MELLSIAAGKASGVASCGKEMFIVAVFVIPPNLKHSKGTFLPLPYTYPLSIFILIEIF